MSVTALMGSHGQGLVEQVENPARQAMAQVSLVTIDEAVLVSKEGTRRTIRGSVAPVVDDGGMVLGAVLVFHEIAPGDHGFLRLDERGEALRKVEERLGPPRGSSTCVPGASVSRTNPVSSTASPRSSLSARRSN